MKLLTKIIVPALTVAISLTGCANAPAPSSTTPKDAQTKFFPETSNYKSAPEIVKKTIAQTGGINNWRKVRKIKGLAIVADHTTTSGKTFANQFKYTLKLTQNQIGKSIKVAEVKNVNPMHFTAYPKDANLAKSIDNAKEITDRAKRQLEITKGFFALVSNQLTGALNLVPDKIKKNDISHVRIHGEIFIRIGHKTSNSAYYFDPKTNILRYVTNGADKAGKLGTITVFHYATNKKSCVLPTSIEVRKLGDHVLLGNTVLFSADFIKTEFSSYAE